jgi:hypothetical protein
MQLNIDSLWGVLSTLTLPDHIFNLQMGFFPGSHKNLVKDIGVLQRELRYMKGTHDIGLKYSIVQEFILVGHTYTDFDGNNDNGVSTSRYLMILGATTISWRSQNSIFH